MRAKEPSWCRMLQETVMHSCTPLSSGFHLSGSHALNSCRELSLGICLVTHGSLLQMLLDYAHLRMHENVCVLLATQIKSGA